MLCFYDLSVFGNEDRYFVSDDGVAITGRRKYARVDRLIDEYRGRYDGALLLLTEGNFSFFGQSFSWDGHGIISHTEYVDVLSQAEFEGDFMRGKLLYAFSHNITSNGIHVDNIVGQTGKLEWYTYFVFLNNPHNYYLKNYLNSVFIIPQSLPTILELAHSSNKKDFGILYIMPHATKYVHVVDGFYQGFDVLNLGSNSLHRMLSEVGLTQTSSSTGNPVAEKLYRDVYGFFVSNLMDRLGSISYRNKSLFLISDLTSNLSFVENFSETYSNYFQGYVVPFSHSPGTNGSGYVDIDSVLLHIDSMKRSVCFF